MENMGHCLYIFLIKIETSKPYQDVDRPNVASEEPETGIDGGKAKQGHGTNSLNLQKKKIGQYFVSLWVRSSLFPGLFITYFRLDTRFRVSESHPFSL